MSRNDEHGGYRSEHGAFAEPDDVIDRGDLTYDAKLDVLQSWKAGLQRGDIEEDDQRLRRVEQAIERLQTKVTLDPDKPERAPSGQGYRPKT